MTRRMIAAFLAVIVVAAGCGSPSPSPTGSERPASSPGADTPTPQGVVPTPDGSGDPAAGPSGMPPDGATAFPVPPDIAADVDALYASTTPEDAIAATRAILERSGVVIADDATTVVAPPSGVILTTYQLERMAEEAAASAALSRVSLTEFASRFGGIAGLAPNDGLLDRLATLDVAMPTEAPTPAASTDPGSLPPPNDQLSVDLSSYPRRMATFLTDWLRLAAEHRGVAGPEMAALTSPPLYLQAFAQRGDTPVDLAAPFVPDDLRLGALQLTILVAGMRASLAYAAGDEIATMEPDLVLASARRPLAEDPATSTVGFSDCNQLRRLLDTYVPLSIGAGMRGKAYIKSMVQGFVKGLFGSETSLSAAVGPAFTALGMLFKVMGLFLLYESAFAELELQPGFIHKPVGSPEVAAATVKAGITDAAWRQARQERANDPWWTAIGQCARLLGMPVPSDAVDLGEAVKHWVVRWTIPVGGARHAYFAEGTFDGQGIVAQRRERPLQADTDHTGTDTVALRIKPEREDDHPGEQRTEPVKVCALVVPRYPPDGFKTMLSAGMAGNSLAGTSPASAVFSLASLVSDLLISWIREVSTIDACATMSVSFHVPQPMPWRGTVTVNYVSHTELASSSVQYEGWGTRPGEPSYGSGTERMDVDVTETFQVGGMDEEGFPGAVTLAGQSFVHGVQNRFRDGSGVRFSAACKYSAIDHEEAGGGWTLSGDANGSISLYPDGKYTISLYGAREGNEPIELPGRRTVDISIIDGPCDPNPTDEYAPIYPIHPVPVGDTIDGQVDPLQPGNRLHGSQTTVWDETSYTVITWDLTHQGPIRLPQH